MTFADATAEILLTWAADERRNWAQLDGAAGTPRAARRHARAHARRPRANSWPCPPALSDGSRASRLVRSGRRSVRGGSDRRWWRRRQPRRGLALRPAGKSCPRIEPPRRRNAARAAGERARPGGARLSAVTTPSAPPRVAGVLVILPPRAGDPRLGGVRILGLPLARRLALAATSAGYVCVFAAGGAADAAVLEGTAVRPWPDAVPSGSGPHASGAGAGQRPRAAALAARDPRDAAGAGDAPRRCLAGRGRGDQARRGDDDGRPRRYGRGGARAAACDVHDHGAAGGSRRPPIPQLRVRDRGAPSRGCCRA